MLAVLHSLRSKYFSKLVLINDLATSPQSELSVVVSAQLTNWQRPIPTTLKMTNTDIDINSDPLAASPSKSRRNLSRLLRSGGALAAPTAKNQQRTNKTTNWWLWLFVGLAFFVSITNIIIGQRSSNSIYHHHEHELMHEQSPVERLTIITTYDIQQLRGGDSIDATTKNSNDDQEEVHTGEYITQILKGDKPFPSKNDNNNIIRLRYKPGTLQLSHADTLQFCYVNTTIYAGHITDRPQSLVSLSDKYKLIYRNIPKSSSSSARHAMQDFLEGDDNRMKHDTMEELVHERGYSMVSFVREPMNRFYSSYDEAFFR